MPLWVQRCSSTTFFGTAAISKLHFTATTSIATAAPPSPVQTASPGGGGRGSFIGRGEMPHGKGCTQFPHWRHLCWYSRQLLSAQLSHCNHQCCNTIPTLVQPPRAVTLSPPPMKPLPQAHFTTVQLTPTQLPCCCHLSCCHADFTGSYAVSSTSFKLLLAQS